MTSYRLQTISYFRANLIYFTKFGLITGGKFHEKLIFDWYVASKDVVVAFENELAYGNTKPTFYRKALKKLFSRFLLLIIPQLQR